MRTSAVASVVLTTAHVDLENGLHCINFHVAGAIGWARWVRTGPLLLLVPTPFACCGWLEERAPGPATYAIIPEWSQWVQCCSECTTAEGGGAESHHSSPAHRKVVSHAAPLTTRAISLEEDVVGTLTQQRHVSPPTVDKPSGQFPPQNPNCEEALVVCIASPSVCVGRVAIKRSTSPRLALLGFRTSLGTFRFHFLTAATRSSTTHLPQLHLKAARRWQRW